MVELTTEPQEKPKPAADQPKHEMSAGEKIFDRTVYTGIGFGVNEVSSLWITDQFMHGKNLFKNVPGLKTLGTWFSEEGFHRVSDGIAKTFKLTEQVAKDGKIITPRARAGNSLLMVTLISGGTLLILPMKWLEDNKSKWVKRANHMVDNMRGNKLTPEQVAARDAQVEQDIACAPRQSWPSMLIGRTIAVASSITSGTIIGADRNEKLMNWSEKKLTGSIQPEGQKNTAHRWARLISVETYSCAISSIVLEVMSKLFAKRSSKPHDPELCQRGTATIASLPTSESDNKNTAAKSSGNYCAKIQAQKDQAASQPVAMQV